MLSLFFLGFSVHGSHESKDNNDEASQQALVHSLFVSQCIDNIYARVNSLNRSELLPQMLIDKLKKHIKQGFIQSYYYTGLDNKGRDPKQKSIKIINNPQLTGDSVKACKENFFSLDIGYCAHLGADFLQKYNDDKKNNTMNKLNWWRKRFGQSNFEVKQYDNDQYVQNAIDLTASSVFNKIKKHCVSNDSKLNNYIAEKFQDSQGNPINRDLESAKNIEKNNQQLFLQKLENKYNTDKATNQLYAYRAGALLVTTGIAAGAYFVATKK